MRPPKGLNTDGVFQQTRGTSTAGGLLRDDSRSCIHWFSYHIGVFSVLCTELWGILIGLEMAWNEGYRKLLLEVDSATAVQLLSSASNLHGSHKQVVSAIHQLWQSRPWEVLSCHIYREANGSGDWLAAYACPLLLGISYFSEAPFGCVNLLLEDIYSVVTPRFC